MTQLGCAKMHTLCILVKYFFEHWLLCSVSTNQDFIVFSVWNSISDKSSLQNSLGLCWEIASVTFSFSASSNNKPFTLSCVLSTRPGSICDLCWPWTPRSGMCRYQMRRSLNGSSEQIHYKSWSNCKTEFNDYISPQDQSSGSTYAPNTTQLTTPLGQS